MNPESKSSELIEISLQSGLLFANVWFKSQAVRVSSPNLKQDTVSIKNKNRAPQMLVAQFQFLRNRLVAADIGAL